jgi:NADH dehydrogenase
MFSTILPQTAQVASQQGKYLGKKFSKIAHRDHVLALPATHDEVVYRPFRYIHMGSLAYIGNAAVFDMGKFSFMGGLAAMYAWRSVYWNEQVSPRTRALLMIDWIVRWVIAFLYSTVAFQATDIINGFTVEYGDVIYQNSDSKKYYSM